MTAEQKELERLEAKVSELTQMLEIALQIEKLPDTRENLKVV